MALDSPALWLALLTLAGALVVTLVFARRFLRRDRDGAPPRDPNAPYDPRDDFGGES